MIIFCPICKKQTTWENNPNRPFCSERCKLIDLGAWAEGRNSIPGDHDPNAEPLHKDDEVKKDDEIDED